MASHPTLFAHMPGLQITASGTALAGGELVALSFDEWNELDGAFPHAGRSYARAQPVFWKRALEALDAADILALSAQASAAVEPLHRAFLLDRSVPLLPTPALSCSYLEFPAQAGADAEAVIGSITLRRIGPLEREFIVYGSRLCYPYGQADLARVDAIHHFITTHAGAADECLHAALDTLEETARPDSWYAGDAQTTQQHGFVRCIAACESLLMPPRDEAGAAGLTQTFGQHAATLLTPPDADFDAATAWFRALYGLRSDLMHGRDTVDEQAASTLAMLAEGRSVLRNIILAAWRLRASDMAGPPLWQRLVQTGGDPVRRRALASLLHPGDRS